MGFFKDAFNWVKDKAENVVKTPIASPLGFLGGAIGGPGPGSGFSLANAGLTGGYAGNLLGGLNPLGGTPGILGASALGGIGALSGAPGMLPIGPLGLAGMAGTIGLGGALGGGGLLGGLGNLLGGGQGGLNNALDAQVAATAAANRELGTMVNFLGGAARPYRGLGNMASGELRENMPDYTKRFGMSDFEADPGYQFRLNEGSRAIERSAIGRGQLNSGRAAKALTRFNQDFASNEYQRAFDRFNQDRDQAFGKYMGLANLGQRANSDYMRGTVSLGTGISQNLANLGNSIAAQQIAGQNNQNQLMNTLIGGGAGILGGAIAASDKREKMDIKPVSKKDLMELRKVVKPYIFKYTDEDFGEGEWLGLMAQDLEKTKLGKPLVRDVAGVKMIDLTKAASLMLAVTLSEGA